MGHEVFCVTVAIFCGRGKVDFPTPGSTLWHEENGVTGHRGRPGVAGGQDAEAAPRFCLESTLREAARMGRWSLSSALLPVSIHRVAGGDGTIFVFSNTRQFFTQNKG